MFVKTMFVKIMFVRPYFSRQCLSRPCLSMFIKNMSIWFNLIQFDPIWSYLIQFDPIWSNLIQFDPSCYKLVSFFIIVQKNNNKVTLRTLEVNSRGQKYVSNSYENITHFTYCKNCLWHKNETYLLVKNIIGILNLSPAKFHWHHFSLYLNSIR